MQNVRGCVTLLHVFKKATILCLLKLIREKYILDFLLMYIYRIMHPPKELRTNITSTKTMVKKAFKILDVNTILTPYLNTCIL